MLGSALFGINPLPFRIWVFLTQFVESASPSHRDWASGVLGGPVGDVSVGVRGHEVNLIYPAQAGMDWSRTGIAG